MQFVSYAQNYEDVMLWRALRHVESGFYIDVGAQSPETDSVTRAFSLRGWRGVNVEPHPVYFEQLCRLRPHDVNLDVALGEQAGSVTMNFLDNSGLSTADREIAGRHAADGHAIRTQEVGMLTLEQVWQRHVPDGQQVHFLKVDVEGFERAVLTGNDWNRHRPWIVLVEATLPNSQIENHEVWESILSHGGYSFVYADGLNRFYVASERMELAAPFKYPPNVFDGFITAPLDHAQRDLQVLRANIDDLHSHASRMSSELGLAQERAEGLHQQIGALERSLRESHRRIECAEGSLAQAREREQSLRNHFDAKQMALQERLEAERSALRQEIDGRDQLLTQAHHRADVAEQQWAAVLQSPWWRITAPARVLLGSVPRPLRRNARRLAKAAWWAVTPWRVPARLRAIRERDRAATAMGAMTPPLNLYPDRTPGQPAMPLIEPLPDRVSDRDSAARWCIALLRSRPDLRARFQRALSQPEADGFIAWVRQEGGERFGLPEAARALVAAVLQDDFGGSARRYFLFRDDVRETHPHGLTPSGQPALYRWFMEFGCREDGRLAPDEVLWLFMQAAEDPAGELVRAYQMTAAWQQAHPDGLTVFGQRAFAHWFCDTYGGAGEAWTEPASWQVDACPADQLRQAYHAHDEWRSKHPQALDSLESAGAFLGWLRYESALISGEARAWVAALDEEAVAKALVAPGINIIGHFCSPSGVRVSAEAIAAGLRHHGVRIALRDIRTDVKDEPHHIRFGALENHDVTLIHTQPAPFFDKAYARADLAERQPRTYRIAYWYWEFDTVPPSWVGHAAQVDEVWAATEFVARGLRERLPVPVHTMFPGVQLAAFKRRQRSHFGIEEQHFVFLFSFHMSSVMERKNPLGLVRAFKQAFRPEEPVTLVLKTLYGHRHPESMRRLVEAAAGANVQVIDEMYSADEVLSLMEACDAYVSLHRSEGLGLTMAEAMLLGKPVIATGYSGNVDFMSKDNSLMVPYRLVKLGQPMPPYDADLMWAEPDLDQAAALMRRLYDEPEWARELGARGQASAELRLSVGAAGARIVERLEVIRRLRQSGGSDSA